MMYFTDDGKRVFGIICRTWDNEKNDWLWAEEETPGILHPEYETDQTVEINGHECWKVECVQWYIDRAYAWRDYAYSDKDDDNFAVEDEQEKERYERCADADEYKEGE